MYSFDYKIGTKVVFGPDRLGTLGEELSAFGKRVLLVYGGGSIKKSGLYDRITSAVRAAGLTLFELSGVDPNPRITSVREGVGICKREGVDVILAVGGGSVIDCSKGIAAGACYDGDPWDFLTGKASVGRCLPIVTVLTLAATGSEMDAVAVISNAETEQKLVFSNPALRPAVSFLDPTLTYSVSRYQTACGSADILSHIMEDYFLDAPGSMYMLDRFKEGMMKTVIHYAPIALEKPDDYEARANLMWTSSWAINGFSGALTNAAWTCHTIEHELSAFYDITHGLGLAIVTPRWMRYVLDDTTAPKFYDFAVNVFGVDAALSPMKAAEEGISRLESFLYGDLGLKSTLTDIGIDDSRIPQMAERAAGGGALHGWRPLKAADIEKILRDCL